MRNTICMSELTQRAMHNPFMCDCRLTGVQAIGCQMSKRCFVGWHLLVSTILGIPLLLVTCIIIPLLPFCLLFWKRRDLRAPKVQIQLGYVYRSYR